MIPYDVNYISLKWRPILAYCTGKLLRMVNIGFTTLLNRNEERVAQSEFFFWRKQCACAVGGRGTSPTERGDG